MNNQKSTIRLKNTVPVFVEKALPFSLQLRIQQLHSQSYSSTSFDADSYALNTLPSGAMC